MSSAGRGDDGLNGCCDGLEGRGVVVGGSMIGRVGLNSWKVRGVVEVGLGCSGGWKNGLGSVGLRLLGVGRVGNRTEDGDDGGGVVPENRPGGGRVTRGRLAGGGSRPSREAGILGCGGGPRLKGSSRGRAPPLNEGTNSVVVGNGAAAGVVVVSGGKKRGGEVVGMKLKREGKPGGCCCGVAAALSGRLVGRKGCFLSWPLSRPEARMLDLTRGRLPSGMTLGPRKAGSAAPPLAPPASSSDSDS